MAGAIRPFLLFHPESQRNVAPITATHDSDVGVRLGSAVGAKVSVDCQRRLDPRGARHVKPNFAVAGFGLIRRADAGVLKRDRAREFLLSARWAEVRAQLPFPQHASLAGELQAVRGRSGGEA